MANYTTIFGETVDFTIVPIRISNFKFIVEKRVDGKLRTSYPMKSSGAACKFINKAVKA
jgi:hypothetical protein